MRYWQKVWTLMMPQRGTAKPGLPTRMLALMAATCLLGCTAGSAPDKSPAAPSGQSHGYSSDQVAGQTDRQQELQNQQWVQHSNEEIKLADTPDKLFVLSAAEANIFELLLTQTAKNNAHGDKVKQIADHLHQDHQQLGREIQRLIEQQGLLMPQGISPMLQQELKVIRTQQGEQFDTAFISAMKAAHTREISKCEDMSKMAKDQGVKAFATKALPTLQQHLQQIRDLGRAF